MEDDFEAVRDLLEMYKRDNDVSSIQYVLSVSVSSNIVPMMDLILEYLTFDELN